MRRGLSSSVESGRILLAEDDPALRQMLARRLTSEGYEVKLVDRPQRLGDGACDLDADIVITSVNDGGPAIHDVRQRSDVLLVLMLPTNTGVMEALDVV